MSDFDSQPDEYDGTEAYIKPRRMVRRSGRPFSTDIADSEDYKVYESLFSSVHNGACQLMTVCLGYHNTLEGQMGMVDFDDGNGVQAVTALHNIIKRFGVVPKFTLGTFSGSRHNESFEANFQHISTHKAKIQQLVLSIDNVATSWEYGVDITHGKLQDQELSKPGKKYHVFSPVPREYDYAVGTKIAMAIFAKQVATGESARITEQGVNPMNVYGVADEISIYTGIITENGGKFFVHDINSYRGCSGALIFLLDGPDGGKCIGVHIGSPLDIKPAVNLAIKIHETPTLITSPIQSKSS